MADSYISRKDSVQLFLDQLAKRLREYREKNEYTVERLAEILGYSNKSSISRLESGQSRPSIEVLAQLSKLYGCTLKELIGDLGEDTQNSEIRFARRMPSSLLLTDSAKGDIQRGIDILSGLLNGETLDDLYKRAELSKYRGNKDIIIGFLRNLLLSGEISFTHIPLAEDLQHQLVAKYPVLQESVFIVDIPNTVPEQALRPELVAWTASHAVLSRIENAQRIGVAGGYTLSRMCQVTPPRVQQFNGTCWTPLTAYRDEESNNRSANTIAQHMRFRHYSSTSIYLPYISPDNYIGNKNYQNVLNAWERLSIAFVSGHSRGTVPPSYESIFRRLEEIGLGNRLAGEFLGYVLDSDGQVLGGAETLEAMNEATIRVPLQSLQQCIERTGKVYFVGAGKKRASVVRAALNMGYINGLVADRSLVEELLT